MTHIQLEAFEDYLPCANFIPATVTLDSDGKNTADTVIG